MAQWPRTPSVLINLINYISHLSPHSKPRTPRFCSPPWKPTDCCRQRTDSAAANSLPRQKVFLRAMFFPRRRQFLSSAAQFFCHLPIKTTRPMPRLSISVFRLFFLFHPRQILLLSVWFFWHRKMKTARPNARASLQNLSNASINTPPWIRSSLQLFPCLLLASTNFSSNDARWVRPQCRASYRLGWN